MRSRRLRVSAAAALSSSAVDGWQWPTRAEGIDAYARGLPAVSVDPCASMKSMARRAKVIPFPRSRQADHSPTFVEVRRCRDQGEALVVRALLDSEGISAVLRSNLAHSVHPFSVGVQGEVIVLTARDDAERARAILDS